MTANDLKQIIENNRNDIAFLVGNGINRYQNESNLKSWDELLLKLWKKVTSQNILSIPNGISMTEFYDILELNNEHKINLQNHFSEELISWKPENHHKIILEKIKHLNAPILTTNFDETLAKVFDFKLFKTQTKGFTDYYPWTTYHGENQYELPTDGCGIWYINGMIKYRRSLRLGLTHYMGSVERARILYNKGNEKSLPRVEDINKWKGNKTWLNIFFNKSLFVFGLGLNENETFLRWLLIQRFKFLKRYGGKNNYGWYLLVKSEKNNGKKFFLENVGFKVIEVDSYTEIYEHIWK